jgi:outer membrane receptor protein involved in Fe transport
MTGARHLALIAFVAGTLAPSLGQAQDVDSLLEVLEENVVSGASRSDQRAGQAPATSTTITAEELRRFGIVNLGDALNFLSLGMFSHDRMSTPEVGARGVAISRDSNSHVLVVLDGMVVNEQGGGAAFLHDIPMDVVDHIEVILGPGSVLYGAQAMLGVINVVTKAPADYAGVHTSARASVSPPLNEQGDVRAPTSLFSLGHEDTYSAGFGHTSKLLGRDLGVVGSLDYSEFKGPEFSFAKQALPDADLGPHAQPGYWGGPVRDQWFHRTAGGYLRLELGDFSWNTRATRTELAMPQMDLFESRAPSAYDDPRNLNEYDLLLSNLRYSDRFSQNVTGMARLYFGYSRRQNDRLVIGHDEPVPGTPLGVIDPEQCPIGPTGPCRQEALYLSRWLGLELQSTYDWFGDSAYETMVGVDGRLRTAAYEFVTFDELSGRSYGSDPAFTRWHAGGADLANEHAIGAYLQQTAQPFPFLSFNAGVRADIDSRLGSNFTGRAISPRVAAIVSPEDNLSLKFIYSDAFRAPSFLELNIVNGRLLPNPNGLEPETVQSGEAAATWRFSSHSFTLGGFYANWKNLIELRRLNAVAPIVSRFENVTDVVNYGGSLSLQSTFLQGRIRTGLNSMYTVSERELRPEQQLRSRRFGVGDRVPLAVAPRVYGNARAFYRFGEDTAIGLAGGYFGRRIADQAFFGGEPSNLVPRPEAPPQLELRAALTGSFPRFDGVGYTLGANYAFASKQPFVVGPNQGLPRYLDDTPVDSQLALVNRLSLFAGLSFDLDGAPDDQPPATDAGGATQ